MTRRPGDNSPPPPDGGAAERQRQFLEARMTPEELAAELGEDSGPVHAESDSAENDHAENEESEQEPKASED
jgi:hypothetical protein